MKKLALFIAALMIVSFVSVPVWAAESGKKKVVIGITQIVEHPSLDDIRRGFIDYLAKLEKIQPPAYSDELGSTWKDFGRKRNVLRL
mgnify:CR=1 FL=1